MASGDDQGAGAVTPPPSTRVHGREAAKAHVTLTIGLTLCVVAFWFELRRALGGNALSWAYVFEWPLLAAFAVYMWWKVLHPATTPTTASATRAKKEALAPEFEGMLEAWEEHRRQVLDAAQDESKRPSS